MKKAYLVLLFSMVVMILLNPSIVRASQEDEVDVTVTVPVSLHVWITDASGPGGAHITLLDWDGGFESGPSLQDYLDGETDQKGLYVHLSANVNWTVTIEGTSSHFIHNGSPSKSVSDILWENGGGPFPLSESPATVYEYPNDDFPGDWMDQPEADEDWSFDMSFKILLHWDDDGYDDDAAGVHYYDTMLFTIEQQ